MGGVFRNLEVPLLGLVYLFLLGRSEPHPRLSLVHPWRLGGARASADHTFSAYSFRWLPSGPAATFPSHLVLSPAVPPRGCCGRLIPLLRIPSPGYATVLV